VVNVTSTNNNDVIAKVVSGVEITKVIGGNSLNIIAVSLNGLSHHVLSVNVEVAVLKGGLHVAVVVVFMLLSNFLFNELELISIKSAASDKVTKKLDSFANVTLENLKRKVRIFSISLAGEAATHVFNGLGNIALVAVGGSAEKHLLEEVGSA
jgi:hypothetical protein